MIRAILLVVLVIHGASCQGDDCTQSGRFRHNDATCKMYFLCIKLMDVFIKTDYACPKTAIFNPSSNRCSQTAQCIQNICDNVPESIALIPDPNAIGCKTYIECMGKTKRQPVVRKCRNGYFNKDLKPVPACWLIPSC